MDYKNLVIMIKNMTEELASWQSFYEKTYEMDTDLHNLKSELEARERIVEKEKVVARERKELLDAREKNIEVTEARLQRLAKI